MSALTYGISYELDIELAANPGAIPRLKLRENLPWNWQSEGGKRRKKWKEETRKMESKYF